MFLRDTDFPTLSDVAGDLSRRVGRPPDHRDRGAGGVLGRISKISDLYITLEISSGAELVVQKNSVTMVLPKGTLKAL